MKVYFNSEQLIDGAVDRLRSDPAIFHEDNTNRGLPHNWKRFVADVGDDIDIVIGTMQVASICEATISIIDRRTKRCHLSLFHDEGEMTAVDVIRGSAVPVELSAEAQTLFQALHRAVISSFNEPFSFDAEDQAPAIYGMTG